MHLWPAALAALCGTLIVAAMLGPSSSAPASASAPEPASSSSSWVPEGSAAPSEMSRGSPFYLESSPSDARRGGGDDDESERPLRIHLHIATIGDSLTIGVFRNLLQVKALRRTQRYLPFGQTVAKQLLQMRHLPPPSRAAGVNASGRLYARRLEVVSVSQQRHAFPSAATDHISSEYLAWAREALAAVANGSAATALPHELHRQLAGDVNHGGDGANSNSQPGGDNETATASPRPIAATADVEPDVVVISCSLLLGTNDALNAPGSAVAKGNFSLEKSLGDVFALHRRCRDFHASAVAYARREMDSPQQSAASSSSPPAAAAAGAARARRSLRRPVVVLNHAIGMPPLMLRPDTYVMRNVLIPKRRRYDAHRQFGSICFSGNASGEAILRRHGEINRMLSTLDDDGGGGGDGKVAVAVPRSRGNATAATLREYLALAPAPLSAAQQRRSRLRFAVARGAVLFDEHLTREPLQREIDSWGGLYCDCVHPSFEGLKILCRVIGSSLVSELYAMLSPPP